MSSTTCASRIDISRYTSRASLDFSFDIDCATFVQDVDERKRDAKPSKSSKSSKSSRYDATLDDLSSDDEKEESAFKQSPMRKRKRGERNSSLNSAYVPGSNWRFAYTREGWNASDAYHLL